jgi:hypothetical protein
LDSAPPPLACMTANRFKLQPKMKALTREILNEAGKSPQRTSLSGSGVLLLTLTLIHCAPTTKPHTDLLNRHLEGRRIVEQAVEVHGGMERWNRFAILTARYEEHWSWPFTWLGKNPWPVNNVRASLKLWLHEARAEAVFEDQGGQTWAYSDGKVTVSGTPARPSLHWKPWFVLPRTHYLTLLPFKFLDPGVQLEYLGKTRVAGLEFDEVLVTFAENVGTTPRDKYWALFDRGTARLTRLRLTVTAYGRLAVGEIIYEGYKQVQGIQFASRLRGYWRGPAAKWPLHLGTYYQATLEE